MSWAYTCALDSIADGIVTVRIAFGVPATNDRIVPDAIKALDTLDFKGGRGIRFDGPASLHVAMALAHAVAHRFGFVARRDPELGRFVFAISHNPAVRPGDLLE